MKVSFKFAAFPTFSVIQVEFLIAMLSLVLVLALSTWMMLLVFQVLASYWSVLAVQSQDIIVLTLRMLVLGVKVLIFHILSFNNLNIWLQQLLSNTSSLQLLAQLVNCDWWEVIFPMRAGWRSA